MAASWIGALISGISNLLPAIGGLFAHGFKGFKQAWQSAGDSVTGAHLTGAQKEANAFNAEQAQRQMDFQQQMRDTQHQSAVIDMKSAGLNPALMYSNGSSGNSAMSGAAASSVAPSPADPMGLLGQMMQLSLLKSQKANIDADTENKRSNTLLSSANAQKVNEEIRKMSGEIEGIALDNEYKKTINKYLDDMQLAILSLTQSQDYAQQRNAEKVNREIFLLDTEEQSMLQDIIESKQRVISMIKDREFTDENINQIRALIRQIEVNTDNLTKTGKLLEKDLDWYTTDKVLNEVNHVLDVGADIAGSVISAITLKNVALIRNAKTTGRPVYRYRNRWQ